MVCKKTHEPKDMSIEHVFFMHPTKVYYGCTKCDNYLKKLKMYENGETNITPELPKHDCDNKGKILGIPKLGPYVLCTPCINSGWKPYKI
jgi:hypothetical protein